jgi:hypothetical protein
MDMETSTMTRFAASLIHFYFVPPASRLATEHTAAVLRPPEDRRDRPSHLRQCWAQKPDGTLVGSWQQM